jgi:hypothetical protein
MVSIYPSLVRGGRQGCHLKRMISQEVYAMNIPKKEITVALACRTREVLMARKALFAAATIHMTTVVILLAGLAILVHALHA